MLTEKLYYQDPNLKEFTASIVTVLEKINEYHLELDRTAFYPEGGGQPADKGTIAGIEVKYVYEDGDKVYHVIENLPSKKKDLDCNIYWERRFDHMQQHTGQHVLSAVLHDHYQAATIGFHLSDEYVSIDIDKQLEAAELQNAEFTSNQIIYHPVDVEATFPDEAELEKLNLREMPTVKENIRIIKIGELDYSPCGGTHLNSTGQLGIIKITEVENYKGGMRLKFLCGRRALKEFSTKNNLVNELREMLSVANDHISEEVERLQQELQDAGGKNKELNNELLNFRAEKLLDSAELVNEVKIIKKIFTAENFNSLRFLAGKITSKDNTITILGLKDGATARLMLGRSKNLDTIKMNELIKTPLEMVEGRGGGNALQAQGGGNKPEKLEEAVEAVYNNVLHELSKL